MLSSLTSGLAWDTKKETKLKSMKRRKKLSQLNTRFAFSIRYIFSCPPLTKLRELAMFRFYFFWRNLENIWLLIKAVYCKPHHNCSLWIEIAIAFIKTWIDRRARNLPRWLPCSESCSMFWVFFWWYHTFCGSNPFNCQEIEINLNTPSWIHSVNKYWVWLQYTHFSRCQRDSIEHWSPWRHKVHILEKERGKIHTWPS